jgi:DNA polymerase-3 subunit delta
MPSELKAVTYVSGSDASLVAQGAHAQIRALLGDRDPSLVVEEFGGPTAEEFEVGAIVDSLMTPGFLVDRRIVVVRDAGKLNAADATRLMAAFSAMPTSSLCVLVAGGGTVPASLVTWVKEHGHTSATQAGTGKARTAWIADHVKDAPVRLTPRATEMLSQHLGEDLGRLEGIFQVLLSTYGGAVTIDVDELAPYLGDAGGVPPWDLTDAIDKGNASAGLEVLSRMLEAGGRAGPEIVSLLHRHFAQMLKLDGTSARSREEAAQILGSSPFPAGKALDRARTLGSAGITSALSLIATADVEVKGMSALEPSLVLEILVARLARLGGRAGRR